MKIMMESKEINHSNASFDLLKVVEVEESSNDDNLWTVGSTQVGKCPRAMLISIKDFTLKLLLPYFVLFNCTTIVVVTVRWLVKIPFIVIPSERTLSSINKKTAIPIDWYFSKEKLLLHYNV